MSDDRQYEELLNTVTADLRDARDAFWFKNNSGTATQKVLSRTASNVRKLEALDKALRSYLGCEISKVHRKKMGL